MEPNVATTRRRTEMLKTVHKAGIHTGVWLCPVLPFINDTEENLGGLLAVGKVLGNRLSARLETLIKVYEQQKYMYDNGIQMAQGRVICKYSSTFCILLHL